MKVWAIARNTFREAKRDRVLYLLFFFAAGAIVFSRVLALLTVGDKLKIIRDVGLASISFFGVLMAVLMGTGLVYKEIDKKTIYTLLAKPISRPQFILGKFLGLALTLFIMTALMTVIFLGLVFVHSGRVEASLLPALYFSFLEFLLVTAVAILFSTFSTPILSSIFSLAFFLIGHLSWGLELLLRKIVAPVSRAAVTVLYRLLPDLENFNVRTEVVHGLPIPAGLYLDATLYGLVYTAFLLGLAVLIFRRRDFI